MCNYEGHIPDDSKVSKIHNWPPCQNRIDICGFLGTAGTIHIWIKDFATISHPLVQLMKNNVPFSWGENEQIAMDTLKSVIIASPAIQPLNYLTANEVILAVLDINIVVVYLLHYISVKRTTVEFIVP